MKKSKIVSAERGMNILNSVPVEPVDRSTFNLSRNVTLSGKMGRLIPIVCDEVLPGDQWTLSTEQLVRFAPMIAPNMTDMQVKTFCVYVPNRILYEDPRDWENFIMGRTSQNDGPTPEWSWFTLLDGVADVGTLADYLGLPNVGTVGEGLKVSCLPFAAYHKAYDDWFRHQQLQNETLIKLVPGNNASYQTLAGFEPLNIGWDYDPFTACAPNTQQGVSVLIPLTSTDLAPVTLDPDRVLTDVGRFVDDNGDPITGFGKFGNDASGGSIVDFSPFNNTNYVPGVYDPADTLGADVNTVASSINTLRTAFKLQRYFEAVMRVGSRFTDWLAGIWNVRSSDARLQRAELLGITNAPVVVSEVLSTADTVSGADGSPLGTLAGHGISVSGGRRWSYYAEEHGHILVFLTVVPKPAYQQGVHSKFLRDSYLKYPIPHLAQIGEEEVKVVQLYAQCTPEEQQEVFGYRPQYTDHRVAMDHTAGEFRTTLNFWTFTRIFDEKPVLNESFIRCDPATRAFAVEEGHHLYVKVAVNAYVNRNLPMFGIPSLAPGA